MDKLKRVLKRPDPAQLWSLLEEIVEIAGSTSNTASEVRDGRRRARRRGEHRRRRGLLRGGVRRWQGTQLRAGPADLRGAPRERPRVPGLRPSRLRALARSGPATITYYPNDWAISGLYADPTADHRNVERACSTWAAPRRKRRRACDGRFSSRRCSTASCGPSRTRCADESIERVDLLKIDVEKAELDVLAGIEPADWPRIRQVVARAAPGRPGGERGDRDASTGVASRSPSIRIRRWPGTPIHMLYARPPMTRA